MGTSLGDFGCLELLFLELSEDRLAHPVLIRVVHAGDPDLVHLARLGSTHEALG